MAKVRFGLYRSYATITLPASSACSDSAGVSGRQGTFVLQGQEAVENGKIKATWFVVPGCGARAALRTALEKGQTRHWITSNGAAQFFCLPLPWEFSASILGRLERERTRCGLQIESNYPKRLRRLSVQVTILAS